MPKSRKEAPMDRHIKALKIFSQGTVIPATPLVLDAEKRFDPAGQKLLNEYYLYAGAGGIATAVHSTQFEIRDPAYGLFEPVIRTVAESIDDYERRSRKTVVRICGACGPTEQAVREAETAKRYGYDAVLLSPGGLGDKSEEYLLERTRAVAEVMPVIGFYLQRAVGGRYLSYDYWRRFAEIENVIGVKVAAFNRYATVDVVRAVALSSRSSEIALYTGNDDNIVSDLTSVFSFRENGKVYLRRFDGGLLGHWSVWTRRVVELFARIKNNPGDPELRILGTQITDANGAIFDVAHDFAGCISGIHEVLHRQGLMAYPHCLSEKEKLSPGQSEEIDRVTGMYPFLTDDLFVKKYLGYRARRKDSL